MIILKSNMFSKGKLRTGSWRITLFIFLGLFLQACGVPGSDTSVKEKNVAAGDASVAYKKEEADMKEAKGANTERATFALG